MQAKLKKAVKSVKSKQTHMGWKKAGSPISSDNPLFQKKKENSKETTTNNAKAARDKKKEQNSTMTSQMLMTKIKKPSTN